MPRLSALVFTFAALSASLTPVLSVNPGDTVEICQDYNPTQSRCLTATGMGQPVQMRERDGSQKQQWKYLPLAAPKNNGGSIHNELYDCNFHKNEESELVCDSTADEVVVSPSASLGLSVLPRSAYIGFYGQTAGFGTNYLSAFVRLEGVGKALANRLTVTEKDPKTPGLQSQWNITRVP